MIQPHSWLWALGFLLKLRILKLNKAKARTDTNSDSTKTLFKKNSKSN